MIRNMMCSLAALVALSSPAAGIEFFEGSWDDAFKAAEENGQLVFVDIYTEWCGPCKLMDANVFPTDAVGDYFNARFVNIKLDAEDEDVNGPEIGDRYDVRAYPTLLFLNPDGSELGRGVAGLEVEQLIQLAKEATGEASSGFADMAARYDAGERDAAFVQAFLETAQVAGAKLHDDVEAMVAHRQRMAPVFNEYFASRDKESLINAGDFAVIGAYKSKVVRGDPAVEFVIDNYDAFAAVAPENAVAAFVLESNYYTVQGLASAGDDAYLDQLDMLDGPLRRAAEFQRDLEPDSPLLREFQEENFRNGYLAQQGRWAELKQAVEARLAKPGANRARIYTSASNDFQRAEAAEYRLLAREYAERGYKLDPSAPFAAVTYARSLEQDGRNAEAMAVLERALAEITDPGSALANVLKTQLANLKEPTTD
ncbi:MAG: thioredoxin family protein [Gammaproteobacteria bacterium]|nr:thioredoxin family protein [Gammaproteobacteria bacterium]